MHRRSHHSGCWTCLPSHRLGRRPHRASVHASRRRDEMHLRYRSVLLLVAICTALAVAPAFAAKPAPTAGPTPTNVLGHIGPTSSGAVPCQLGITAPAVGA